jgi:hypothetical protein
MHFASYMFENISERWRFIFYSWGMRTSQKWHFHIFNNSVLFTMFRYELQIFQSTFQFRKVAYISMHCLQFLGCIIGRKEVGMFLLLSLHLATHLTLSISIIHHQKICPYLFCWVSRLKACSRCFTLSPLAIGLFYQRTYSTPCGAHSQAADLRWRSALPATQTQMPAGYPFISWVWGKETYQSPADSGIWIWT